MGWKKGHCLQNRNFRSDVVPTVIHNLSTHRLKENTSSCVQTFHKPKRRPCFLYCGTWGSVQEGGSSYGASLSMILEVCLAMPLKTMVLQPQQLPPPCKRLYSTQSSLDMTLDPRETIQHSRTTQGSAFMAPDRRRCLQPPHHHHHPDGLASSYCPLTTSDRNPVGKPAGWLSFSSLGFHFYSTVSHHCRVL